MPPKGKAKKGRKQEDDDFWEKAGETVEPNPAAPVHVVDDEDYIQPRGVPSLASLMQVGETAGDGEEEDFGGLMSSIKATSDKQKKKDKKKGSKVNSEVSFADGPGPGDGSDGEEAAAKGDITLPKAPTQVTAEDLADEEWGPIEPMSKKKKDKKGGKAATPSANEDVEDTAANVADGLTNGKAAPSSKHEPEPPTESAAFATHEDGEGEPEEAGGVKVLSKKEKERLKKEKEKAKKKVQAQTKKTVVGGEEQPPSEPMPMQSAPPSIEAGKDEDEDDDGEEAGGDKKKKKKKKKKAGEAKEEEKKKDEAKPAKKAKVSAAIEALRAAQEAQRLAIEEAKRKEEEEQRRLEEEERQRLEEERLREAAKQLKKEKEKAKREQAKKEGRYLTEKQKKEKAVAEARMKSLLESGVKIEGLQDRSAAAVGKKVAYGNRKKKAPSQAAKQGSAEESVLSPSTPASTVPDLPIIPSVPPTEATPSEATDLEDVKRSWDASEEDEPGETAGVKESWDVDSGEEEEQSAKPVASVASLRSAPDGVSPDNGNAKPREVGKQVNGKATEAHTVVEPKPLPTSIQPPAIPVRADSSEPSIQMKVEESESDSASDSGSESGSDECSDDDMEEASEDGMTTAQRIAAQRKAEAAERRAKRHEEALAARNKDDLRSPICCILGHVDTGKTKLLDKIRQTNVQEGEAGGITQQIGATYFPVDAIKQKTLVLNKDGSMEYKVPGLLIIDTPGHESFTNLRTRGSSLCNIAILVVDIMHGLEPQTLESLRLLRDRKTPFIVALNKIDRLYGWEATPDGAFQESLAKQKPSVQREFADRVEKTIVAFAEQGLNSILYYENKNFARNVSLVPTSAITGEGIPDMIMLLINLTQQRMSERLMYLSELECTVLEVKVIEGLGTTIDVVLSNGVLREGDRIVVCGIEGGAIVTQIRALLTPQPLRELRIKSAYVHHKEVKAALGVKISAPGLEKAIAGSRLLVVGADDDEDDLRDEVMSDLKSLLNSIDKSGRGVCVQASTLGSLEALLEFLRTSKIPVSGINIGPVHKKDVMRAAVMLERARELAVILCFDVQVDKEAEKMAEELGVRLFKADIIYHLFDAFTAYNAEMTEARRRDAAPQAVWPCRLKIIAVFAKRDPIILGVDILDGTLRVGTPLCVVKIDPVTQKKDIIPLGKVTSLEINHKSMDTVKKSQAGGGVAVKIEHAVYQSAKMYGRHFDDKDELLSHITRASIDVLKENFRQDVSKEEWILVKGLKQRLDIP